MTQQQQDISENNNSFQYDEEYFSSYSGFFAPSCNGSYGGRTDSTNSLQSFVEDSWMSGYNDTDDQDEDASSWISHESAEIDDDPSTSEFSPTFSPKQRILTPARQQKQRQLSTAKRKQANGPLVWVLNENGMQQVARLVSSDVLLDTVNQDEEVDRSFAWVSREDIITNARQPDDSNNSSSQARTFPEESFVSPIASKEDPMQAFKDLDLSSSGRRIIKIQDNIITSDDESSSSTSLEDEEDFRAISSFATPSSGLTRKLGNILDASKIKVPFRSNSSNPKQSSDGATSSSSSLRKLSMPIFPFPSPLRRSRSLLSPKSPTPPPILAKRVKSDSFGIDDTDNSSKKEKLFSSAHHEQRRARKGSKKKFKSRSADSEPAEMVESAIIASAKSLSNSMHAHSTPPTDDLSSSKQSIKSPKTPSGDGGDGDAKKEASSYHQQRSSVRKGAKKNKKSRSNDSMPKPSGMANGPILAQPPRHLFLSAHVAPSTPTLQQMVVSPNKSQGKSFHHQQRKARKGAKKQKKSRSADSMPEQMEPLTVAETSLSKSLHNEPQQQSLSTPSTPRRLGSKATENARLLSPASVRKRDGSIRTSSQQQQSMEQIFSSPEGNYKKRGLLQRSDPTITPRSSSPKRFTYPTITSRSSSPKRSTSLRRSPRKIDRNIAVTSTSPKTPTSLRRSHRKNDPTIAATSPTPKTSSFLRRAHDIGDARSETINKKDRQALFGTTASPKRSSSLRRSRNMATRNKVMSKSDDTASPSSPLASQHTPNRRISSEEGGHQATQFTDAYLQRKKSQKMSSSRKSSLSQIRSGKNNLSLRKASNVDSAIAFMKKERQLDLRKSSEQGSNSRMGQKNQSASVGTRAGVGVGLDVSGRGNDEKKSAVRKVSNMDTASVVMKKKKSARSTQLDSIAVKKKQAPRRARSLDVDNVFDDDDEDTLDRSSFHQRYQKLQMSPGLYKRAQVESNLKSLNNKMGSAIGFEASSASSPSQPRMQPKTLMEKRAAKHQSRKKLTNAFQRMMQTDAADSVAPRASCASNNDLEAPLHN